MQKFGKMASSSNENTDKEEVPSKKTKFCGAAKYKTAVNKEWLDDDKYKGISNHSNIDPLHSAYCTMCGKDVYVPHQA